MKKILSILLIALLLTLTLAACTEARGPTELEAVPLPIEAAPEMTPEHRETPEPDRSPERPVAGVTAANVRARYLEEFDLSLFEAYHEFVEFANAPYIVITTEAPVSEFSFVELAEEDQEWGVFEWAEILHALDVLTPEVPFVVTWQALCWTANRGIVFFDEEYQQERFFEIIASGYDGALQLVEREWRILRSLRTPVSGIPENPEAPWTEITVSGGLSWDEALEAVVWSETHTLSYADAKEVLRILSTMDATEVLSPFHYEGQHAAPLFQIVILYGDETVETISSVETSSWFFRFTGTFGSHGDPGYVVGMSEALFELLAAYF